MHCSIRHRLRQILPEPAGEDAAAGNAGDSGLQREPEGLRRCGRRHHAEHRRIRKGGKGARQQGRRTPHRAGRRMAHRTHLAEGQHRPSSGKERHRDGHTRPLAPLQGEGRGEGQEMLPADFRQQAQEHQHHGRGRDRRQRCDVAPRETFQGERHGMEGIHTDGRYPDRGRQAMVPVQSEAL